MIKSATALDPAAEYVWKFSGSPIRIHVALAVIAKLRQQLSTGAGLDASKKKEIGGLLVGRVREGRLEISDIEPLNLDPEQPNFILSEVQKQLLRKSITARQVNADAAAVVGYYRSDVRAGIKLTEDDLLLIREFFRSPLDVFLVMRADDQGKAKAGFFFWDAGSIFSDASFLEFPLDETLLSVSRRAENPPVPPVVAAPAAPKPQDKLVTHASAPVRSRKALYLVLVPLVLILPAIAWVARPYLGFDTQPTPSSETASSGAKPVVYSPLSLWASRSEKVVTITWDSTRPAISDARVAVLTIKDNNTQRDISLTRNQLEANRFVYISTGETVEISLEVFAASGKPTVESIMIAAAQPAQAGRSRSVADAVVRKDVVTRTTQVPTAVPQASTPATRVPVEAAEKSNESPRTFIATTTPRQALAQPSLLTDTPNAPTGTNSAPLKSPEFLGSAPIQVPVQPPARPSLASAPVSLPLVHPAKPLRQVKPVVPSNVVSLLRRPVDVQVRVSIDDKGKVVRVEPLVPPGGINQYLAAAAASTARMWTFQPAQRGDTPLASEVTLTFTFNPKQ